jgi:hypothetical protein
MTLTLAKQTALVLTERLVCQPKPHRAQCLEIFPCFHANKGLKVVIDPRNVQASYSTVHPSGYTVPHSFMRSLDNAIKFCDLVAQACPELTVEGLILVSLSVSDRKRIKAILFCTKYLII